MYKEFMDRKIKKEALNSKSALVCISIVFIYDKSESLILLHQPWSFKAKLCNKNGIWNEQTNGPAA